MHWLQTVSFQTEQNVTGMFTVDYISGLDVLTSYFLGDGSVVWHIKVFVLLFYFLPGFLKIQNLAVTVLGVLFTNCIQLAGFYASFFKVSERCQGQ